MQLIRRATRGASALLLGAAVGCDLLGGPTSSNLQRVGDTTLPDSVRAAYAEDAGRLALRRLQTTLDPAIDQIELPADLVASLYDALARVYNATELAARDSVVTVYHIHTFPIPDVMRLDLTLAGAADWTLAWKRGERLTGNPAVDSLMVRWDLGLDRFYDLTSLDFDLATLHAAAPLNMFALATQFAPIAGVLHAEPTSWVGDGNDITAIQESEAWVLDYSAGLGDCPAGCTERRFWTFRVAGDGSVAFLGARGATPSPPQTTP